MIDVTNIIRSPRPVKYFLDDDNALWEATVRGSTPSYKIIRPEDVGGVMMYRLGNRVISQEALLTLAGQL